VQADVSLLRCTVCDNWQPSNSRWYSTDDESIEFVMYDADTSAVMPITDNRPPPVDTGVASMLTPPLEGSLSANHATVASLRTWSAATSLTAGATTIPSPSTTSFTTQANWRPHKSKAASLLSSAC
jgi:hypothetical protein